MVKAWVSELKNQRVADDYYCVLILITGIVVSRLE
jgi:hypothetical protein